MLPLVSFITFVSRKLTDVEDISCVNLIVGITLFMYSMKALRESLSPFQIRNVSSMKRIQTIIPLCTVNKFVFQTTHVYVQCCSGPMAEPFTCIQLWLLKVKLFNLSTLSSSQVRSNAAANGLKNSSSRVDNFSVWLFTDETAGRPGLLGLWIFRSS